MTDPRVSSLARILVDYSTEVKSGDWVVITGGVLALPLIREISRYVIRAGGHTNILMGSEEITEVELREASDDQLGWISPIEELTTSQADVFISLRALGNTRALSSIPPEKQRIQQTARRELFKTYLQRAAEGKLRWVVTQYPTPASAQDADMSLSEYEDFVYKATFADQPNPVERWNELHKMQARLVDWLAGKQQVVVRGPNSDLTLSIQGRTFINSDGHYNMPSGEIFTGPVEDSAQGWVHFTYPAVTAGREVEGVKLHFEDGKVVEATAKKNQDFLLAMLDSDPGARYLGEFAIGTNYGINRFTKNILFDEKIGGSFHLAVGAGYPETGSKNESSVHWDFICDLREDSEILVDGELFYKNGQFQI